MVVPPSHPSQPKCYYMFVSPMVTWGLTAKTPTAPVLPLHWWHVRMGHGAVVHCLDGNASICSPGNGQI